MFRGHELGGIPSDSPMSLGCCGQIICPSVSKDTSEKFPTPGYVSRTRAEKEYSDLPMVLRCCGQIITVDLQEMFITGIETSSVRLCTGT